MRSIEVLTPGQIRAGARLREERVMFGAEPTHELGVVTIDRRGDFVSWSIIPLCTATSFT